MAAKPTIAVVYEGKDDFAALRKLLRDLLEEEVKGYILELPSRKIALCGSASGKAGLAQRAIDAAQGGAEARADTILVCFDPDLDKQPDEFKFFERAFRDCQGAGPLTKSGTGWLFRAWGRDVTVRPAPWRSANDCAFDKLSVEERTLERVLIGGVLSSAAGTKWKAWAEKAIADLHDLDPKHGWKRAFRLWGAAVSPDAESLVDALLQRDDARGSCLAALRETAAASVLREVLS